MRRAGSTRWLRLAASTSERAVTVTVSASGSCAGTRRTVATGTMKAATADTAMTDSSSTASKSSVSSQNGSGRRSPAGQPDRAEAGGQQAAALDADRLVRSRAGAGRHVVQARGGHAPGPLLRALHAAKDGDAHVGGLGAQPLVARHQRHLQALGVGLAAQAVQQHQAGLGRRPPAGVPSTSRAARVPARARITPGHSATSTGAATGAGRPRVISAGASTTWVVAS